MENALRVDIIRVVISLSTCLNPYFNGKCSQRDKMKTIILTLLAVLILVLMENALRDRRKT